jgi:osmotically inducible lipoprotein OsmB
VKDISRMKAKLVVTAVALLALSACGNDPGTRALTGGAIGVGGAAVLGAPLVAGAAVGAVAGAVTTPTDRNYDRDRDYDDRDYDRRDRRRDRRDRY